MLRCFVLCMETDCWQFRCRINEACEEADVKLFHFWTPLAGGDASVESLLPVAGAFDTIVACVVASDQSAHQRLTVGLGTLKVRLHICPCSRM